MDYDITEVDDKEKFPPKQIWCYWDGRGEFMSHAFVEDEKQTHFGGFYARYELVPGSVEEPAE